MDRQGTRLAYSTGGEKEEEPAPTPSPKGRLSVALEHRPSNRVVTLVRGLPPGAAKDIGASLKGLLSTGGTIKGTTLELQGDHRKRVEEWLRANLKGRGKGTR